MKNFNDHLKNYSIHVLIFFLLFAVSCQKHDSQITIIDQNLVSLDQATIVGRNIQLSSTITTIIETKKSLISKKGELNVKKVLDIIAVPKISPSFYIINYEEGGYVVLAADKRINPVLAFNDKGYFKKRR